MLNKLKFGGLIVSVGFSIFSSMAYATPSTQSINGDLLTALPDAWFFNFTSQTNPVTHHVADGCATNNSDCTTTDGGALVYHDPVRQATSSATGALDAQLTVTGFRDYRTEDLFTTTSQIRHDFVGGSQQNGLGVYSEHSNSMEQVNFGNNGEYLRLTFLEDINLLGFDFASGEHSACSTSTNCGAFELLVFNEVSNLWDTAIASTAITTDFVTFSGITGKDFVIASTAVESGSPEYGWYLSAVAGDAVRVPEPGTLALFGAGLIGFGAIARRRRKTA